MQEWPPDSRYHEGVCQWLWGRGHQELTWHLRWNSWDHEPWGTVRYQSEGGRKNLLQDLGFGCFGKSTGEEGAVSKQGHFIHECLNKSKAGWPRARLRKQPSLPSVGCERPWVVFHGMAEVPVWGVLWCDDGVLLSWSILVLLWPHLILLPLPGVSSQMLALTPGGFSLSLSSVRTVPEALGKIFSLRGGICAGFRPCFHLRNLEAGDGFDSHWLSLAHASLAEFPPVLVASDLNAFHVPVPTPWILS